MAGLLCGWSGHTEPGGSIPVHSARAGFFQTLSPSGVLQLIELSSFSHPYQNGRGSVASEKVRRERRKTARNSPSSRSSWFGQFARNGRSLRDSGRGSGVGKECPDWRDWRRERNCRQTLSFAESMAYEPHNCGGCCLENLDATLAVSSAATAFDLRPPAPAAARGARRYARPPRPRTNLMGLAPGCGEPNCAIFPPRAPQIAVMRIGGRGDLDVLQDKP
jgi:hypothetical protein